jgi:hypothetical protein
LWFWARLGAFLQVVALLGLLLELLGYERLHAHSLALRDAGLFRRIDRYEDAQRPLNRFRRLRMRGPRALTAWLAVLVLEFALLFAMLIAILPSDIEAWLFGTEPQGPLLTALLRLQDVAWFVTFS